MIFGSMIFCCGLWVLPVVICKEFQNYQRTKVNKITLNTNK